MAPALLELWPWLCPWDWVRPWLSCSFPSHNPATQKAASGRPWYGRLSKVWWWCLNSGSYLNARNYLSWKTPRNEISPRFILLLVQPEHLVKVRLWVFQSLNFRPATHLSEYTIYCNYESDHSYQVGFQQETHATLKNSPRGLLYWGIHSKPQGTRQELPTTVKPPRSQGTKEQWVPKHRRKHSHVELATLGTWGTGSMSQLTKYRVWREDLSLFPDPPTSCWGFPVTSPTEETRKVVHW